jgi:hypothetical protein
MCNVSKIPDVIMDSACIYSLAKVFTYGYNFMFKDSSQIIRRGRGDKIA